ncbi:MAG: GSU2086 family protein [Nitrospiria bacterium]
MKKFPPLDLTKIRTYSIENRKSKVKLDDEAVPHRAGNSFRSFLNHLPPILAAGDLKEIISVIVKAHREGKMVMVGMGAHPIKVGLNPVLIDLMEKGVINSLSINGAGIIHDFELAYIGHTSEDVAAELGAGTFGMAEETGRMLNEMISDGVKKGYGIGEAVGKTLLTEKFPYRRNSLLAAGARLGIPVTIHVAIGTDIIHMHPSADGAAIGQGSLRDFHLLTSVVTRLEGGVYLNIGSSVIMPEVFLKALTIARNLKYQVDHFATVNMDFLQHYRPVTNVVLRPTMQGGKGYRLTGHHEIMVPLLAAGIIESLASSEP